MLSNFVQKTTHSLSDTQTVKMNQKMHLSLLSEHDVVPVTQGFKPAAKEQFQEKAKKDQIVTKCNFER